MPKSAKDFLEEANNQIKTISQKDAKSLDQDKVVYVDVRSKESFDAGHIEGAVHAERGMLEFYTDPNHRLSKPELQQDKTYVVYCDVGGQGALSTKLMKDMGMKNVQNLAGGYQDWQK